MSPDPKVLWSEMADLSDFRQIKNLVDSCIQHKLFNTPAKPRITKFEADHLFRFVHPDNSLSPPTQLLPSGFYVIDVETVADNKRLALASAWDILNQKWWVWLSKPGEVTRLETEGKILGIAHRASFEHSFFRDSFYLDSDIKWLDTHVMACNRYHPAKISLYRAMPYLPMFKGSNDLSLKELAASLAGLVLDKDIVDVFIRAKGEEWRESYERIHPDWVSRLKKDLKESGDFDQIELFPNTSDVQELVPVKKPVKTKKPKYDPTYQECLDYAKKTYPDGSHECVIGKTKLQESAKFVWEVTPTLSTLFDYNFGDVQATVAVFKEMWGWYRDTPYHHIAGLFHRSACFLPLASDWFVQTEQIEQVYLAKMQEMVVLTEQIENNYIKTVGAGVINDGLDWSVWGKTCKDKTKIGKYKWQGVGFNSKKLMTIGQIFWDGSPLVLVQEDKKDKNGEILYKKGDEIRQFNRWHTCDLKQDWLSSVKNPTGLVVFDNPNNTTKDLKDTTGVFSKAFLPYWVGQKDEETGVVMGARLSSENPACQKIAQIYSTVSYWQGFRKRVLYDLPVMKTQTGYVACSLHTPAGTVTNRSIDSILLTMSKPDHNKIGSELYNYVCAPAGYSFVSADLDSIQNIGAALVAAVAHNYYQGLPLENIDCMNNEFSRVTILGDKSKHTTMAWLLAIAMGLENDLGYALGKNGLYAMIFGVGLEKLSLMLGSAVLAEKNITYLKGVMNRQTRQWSGGIGSEFFNFLPVLADGLVVKNGEGFQTNDFKSIFLQRKLPEILTLKRRGKDLRGTANNAVLQSLDVDCLNYMVTEIIETAKKEKVWVKYCQSVHDMKQFLCLDEDADKLADIFQRCHKKMVGVLLTQMGIDPKTFPEKNKVYSGVEISKRWVKSLKDDGVTLSNLDGFDKEITGTFATDADCYDAPVFDDDFVSSAALKNWCRTNLN